MRLKAISRGQKRVPNYSTKSTRARALHLVLGDEHDIDREAAEKLRQYHLVPRKKQPPFPFARKVGFSGCWFACAQGASFNIQEKDKFVETFEERLKMSWYLRIDPRGNRKPRPTVSSPIETNMALRTGLSRVLADLVRAGEVGFVRSAYLKAAEAGMEVLEKRTGYRRSYMAGHPDAEGTLSVHFGLWTVDPIQHTLIGRSADGKRGRKGLRTLGHCFRSLLLLDEALPLPSMTMQRPKENLSKRDPDDWAALQAMNQAVEVAISRRPDGPELLAKAKKYQVEAAEDWVRRYQTSSGLDLEKKRQQRERQKRAVKKWAAKREEKYLQDIEVIKQKKKLLKEKLVRAETMIGSLDRKNRSLLELSEKVKSLLKALMELELSSEIKVVMRKITELLGMEKPETQKKNKSRPKNDNQQLDGNDGIA